MKMLAVKFCGGCSPRFDRNAAFLDIKAGLQGDFAVCSFGDNHPSAFDAVVIIKGCGGCSFDICHDHVFVVSDTCDAQDIIKQIKEQV